MRKLLFIFPLLLLFSCETQRLNRLCEEGEAVTIAYSNWEFPAELDQECLWVMNSFSTRIDPSVPRNHWLIANQASYDSVHTRIQEEWEYQKEFGPYPADCDTLILPEIDFAQHTLLYLKMSTTGCEQLEREIDIVRCDESQTYQVRLEWPYKGGCLPLVTARVWLMLPPLEPGYTVEVRDETY